MSYMGYLQERYQKEVLDYLGMQRMAVLSTHAEDNTIDASAVFFLADRDLHFYFSTKVGTRKYKNMATNPQVTLTIPSDDELKTVELKGTASVLSNPKEITDHITMLINKNRYIEGSPWAPPIAKLDAGPFVIVKITPSWLRYGVFQNEEPTGEYFKQIIPLGAKPER